MSSRPREPDDAAPSLAARVAESVVPVLMEYSCRPAKRRNTNPTDEDHEHDLAAVDGGASEIPR